MTGLVRPIPDCTEAAMVLVPAVPFHRFLGMREEVVEGETRYLMDFCENHVGNPLIRTFHGGVLASFGEVVAATHLARSLARVELPACSTLTFDYLRPAFAGHDLRRAPHWAGGTTYHNGLGAFACGK